MRRPLVHLSRFGFKAAEFPITVEERRAGVSMYSPFKAMVYPAKTALMVLLAVLHARYSGQRVLDGQLRGVDRTATIMASVFASLRTADA